MLSIGAGILTQPRKMCEIGNAAKEANSVANIEKETKVNEFKGEERGEW